jgi:predicted AAA+ superfamily ATPase
MFYRWLARRLAERLRTPYVQLVFGARQTGKSTLLRAILPPDAMLVDLSSPSVLARYAARPGRFVDECLALPERRAPHVVFVDEAQSVPALFDAVQHLWDQNRRRWRFVLCGSSARKLRRAGANLLPGRSLYHRVFPLALPERPVKETEQAATVLPLSRAEPPGGVPARRFPEAGLVERLAYGDLPGIVTAKRALRAELLRSYVTVHLQEEIRREAALRDIGAFLRFLPLAASEAGSLVNYAAVANEADVSQPTVKAYYELLEDMLVGFRVDAWSRSPRKHLLSTPKFLFFDLGVRNAAAGLEPAPELVAADPGRLFEQWVGLELHRRLGYLGGGRLYHLRTKDGAEIDYIVERGARLAPIEVKWTERPRAADARHLVTFLRENPKRARAGYLVCRCPRPMRLAEGVVAIPWHQL